MSLVKFNGNGELPSLLNEFMGRDGDDLFNWNWPAFARSRVGMSVPAVNIREDNETYHLEIAVPGMKKDDFTVTLDQGKLTVSAQQQHEENHPEARYTKREFTFQSFSRSFWLPETCEQNNIDARYTDGILHISLPKKEEAKRKKPTQIQIS
ncbi:hypothetical protein GCM10028803_31310 [Larkinella knui]|uniref:Hsp20/alpha crystallin family protein n=1 Tax=Larkinella knui TaxID=2025310 RepID=A0A3P1CYU5_9BACT|nr:Hsp20/alpha crystallin family protein [Larkinella knui]RRB18156.1 Hsp20/alpha crystallin family protein [Larkinella knui]